MTLAEIRRWRLYVAIGWAALFPSMTLALITHAAAAYGAWVAAASYVAACNLWCARLMKRSR